MDFVIAASFSLIVMVLAGFVIARHAVQPAMSRDVLRRMARPEAVVSDDIIRIDPRRGGGRPLLAMLKRINLLMHLEQTMWQAGIYMPVTDILLLMLLFAVAGVAIGGALWGDPLFALGLAVGLSALPLVYVRIRRQRRLKEFQRQLPFALDLIKSSLEAGHSLLRGFQVVVAEFADPIGSEFRSMIEQSRLGLPLPRALEEMLGRVPIDDLRLLVVAVRVQSDVGSSLAQIIGRLSELVRTRQRIQQQIRALTAQSRMSGLVVGFLPVVLLLGFTVIQPSYTHTLFHDPVGKVILKVAAALDLTAFVVIRRLLKVEF
jgi:tight adherence protein B